MVLNKSFVLHVTIASPGDMIPTRRVIFDHIESFNRTYASDLGFILQQNSWEHAVAASGAFPQQELNKQIIARANIMVAMFKDKFGSPTTAGYDSGTEEEIELFFSKGGKPAVYFRNDLSKLPTNNLLNLTDSEQAKLSYSNQLELKKAEQLKLVRDYQQKLYGREFFVSDYTPAAAGEVDHEMVMRAMEAIQYQAKELVKESSESPQDKKTIQTTLNKLTKKTPISKSQPSSTQKLPPTNSYDIVQPSGVISSVTNSPRSSASGRTVAKSAATGRTVAKSANTGRTVSKSAASGRFVPQKPNRNTPESASVEPMVVHDGVGEHYQKVQKTGKLQLTYSTEGHWLLGNIYKSDLMIDQITIWAKKQPSAPALEVIDRLRNLSVILDYSEAYKVPVRRPISAICAEQAEFVVYYQLDSGEKYQETVLIERKPRAVYI